MFRNELEKLYSRNLIRNIKDREEGQSAARIIIDGNEYINFSSNDYLGLCNNPYINRAAKNAIDKYGFGSGASRLLSGGTSLHSELEREIALFKETEDALIFNSGYIANISIIPIIAGQGDAIFSDELNHASIIDGCRLSKAKKLIYRHRDIEHLSELLKKEDAKRKVIVTDTVFSMDGDIAPLRDLYNLRDSIFSSSPDSVLLYIDDAHGTGVLGDGKGALSYFGIKPESWIIQMGTFSKALGSYGAFVAGSKEVIEYLKNSARGFIFSTALPSCLIGPSLEALNIIRNDPTLIKRLWLNQERLINGLKRLGFNTSNSETPIIPVLIDSIEKCLNLSNYLLRHRIYAPAIRPPTVQIPRIRFTVTANHKEEDIDSLLNVLSEYKE